MAQPPKKTIQQQVEELTELQTMQQEAIETLAHAVNELNLAAQATEAVVVALVRAKAIDPQALALAFAEVIDAAPPEYRPKLEATARELRLRLTN